MSNSDGLDKWISEKRNEGSSYPESLFPHERVTLYSLKERIIELESMRDQILYELDRLKMLAEKRL
jgi:hypothetical protein